MNSKPQFLSQSRLSVNPSQRWIVLAKAFWSDEAELVRHLAEVQSFVDLIEFSRERKLETGFKGGGRERVRIQKLLEIGRVQTLSAAANSVTTRITENYNAFYRLDIEARWVLLALYQGRCSYAQIAETLNVSEREVSEIAWSGRLELASTQSLAGWSVPTGSRRASAQCPDYDSRDPWTQRYLDGEFNREGAAFMQSHLMNCGTCRDALNGARALYSKVKGWVPEIHSDELERIERSLNRVQGKSQRMIAAAAFGKSFWMRKDVWFAVAAFAAFAGVLIVRGFF